MQENNSYSFFVGTFTNSESQGIYKYLLQKDGSLKRIGLVAISDNPSFLTMSADKKYLLAVNEINNKGAGAVESFLITDDSLAFISRSSSGGADPCFIAVNEAGFVLAANYTGGNVGLLRLNNKGELTALLDVQTHTISDIKEDQQRPHAHAAWFEPVDNNIISVDLGTNELWFSHLDPELQKLVPSNPQKLEMEPGAGPRHLVFHPNGKWIYVVNEQGCTVTLVQKSDNGKYKKGVSVSTLPIGYTEPNSCADIHISSDGKFVYASNRGHNSIAIYDVNADNGSLNLVGHESTRGYKPRNFSLSPDDKYLLVANQHTNNIVSFKRDITTGLLQYIDQIEAPTPVCILF
jgi:6-phosphogluconolactonase